MNFTSVTAAEKDVQPSPQGGALAGRVAVVTGGSSGIGLAIARLLSRQGARIAVLARDDELLALARSRSAQGAPRHRWLVASGDVGRAADVEGFMASVEQDLGDIDIVVSNAGFHHAGAIEDVSHEAWRRVFDTHVGGAFLFSRAAFAHWKRRRRGGCLVFVASKAGVAASPGVVAYASAKAAQLQLARCLAEEGGPHGIRVNCVLPDGVIRGTGIFDDAQRAANARRHGVAPDALEHYYAQRNALKTSIGPEDVARAVLFLCSETHSATITGASLTVDGGLCAAYAR
ncbi:SDR family oxidoreductase [Variovorax sp. PBL-E5]|uniref:SDR family oxidoreductase n=1 Tax=Variovorax sp. PBL-E5 TaxID=434014 RepID=UPI001317D69B|nr:SDR family oxidoreductase [Variovorax sp. PBL-E5]VTU38212.1 Glucose 1-dehydrogenase 4 [Variovorax sp. PBL-E5]